MTISMVTSGRKISDRNYLIAKKEISPRGIGTRREMQAYGAFFPATFNSSPWKGK
jgi:hypothetical protein